MHIGLAGDVAIGLVIAILAIAAARLIGACLGWPPAGALVVLAMTPLVPHVELALGLSLDDVLPVVGLVLLIPTLRDWHSLTGLLKGHQTAVRLVLVGVALAMLAGLIASLLNAVDLHGFVRYLGRSTGRYAFLTLIAASVGAAVARHSTGQKTVARAVAVMGTLEAALGLFAFVVPLPYRMGLGRTRPWSVLFGHVPGRISGTLGMSANFTGAVLMVSLIITVGLLAKAETTRGRVGWGLAAIPQLVALTFTFSRAPLALGIVGLTVLLILVSRPILLAPLAAILGVAALLTPLLGRFTSDVTNRLALWFTGFHIMLDHPIAGVGPGQMVNAIRKHPDLYLQNPLGRAISSAHNSILLAGAETGILGAIGLLLANLGLLWLAAAVLRRALPNRRHAILPITGAIAVICFVAQSMVNNLFTVGVTSVMLAIVVGAFLLPAPTLSSSPELVGNNSSTA
jgi:O-Antigen ligase